MLSFNPDQPFAGINLGLDDAFTAQAQQAQQAQLLTDDQYKLISELYDPKTSLAYQKAAADVASPQLTTQVDARTVPEGIMKGIAAGVGNIQQMRQFGKRQQVYRDIAQQQQAYQQQQIDIANKRIQAQQAQDQEQLDYIKQTRPDLYPLARVANREQRGAMMTKEIGTAYKPIEAQQEAQAKIQQANAERMQKEQQFQDMSGMSIPQFFEMVNAKQITPQMANIWKYTIGGDIPTDLNDYQTRILDLQSKQEGLYKQQQENELLPQMNAAELDAKLIANQTAQIGQALKQLELQYAPEKLADEANARHMSEQEKIKKTQDAQRVREIVTNANVLLGQGKLTPENLVTMQTSLRALGAGDALAPIVANFASTGKDGKGPSKAVTATQNANQAGKAAEQNLIKQGWQKHSSGWWYNPVTKQFKAP